MPQLQRLAIAPSQIQNQQIALTSQQHHYLSRVLRLREGDRFIAMDGMGQWWLAQLGGMEAQILEPISMQTELPVAITLITALPKNGFDEVVRSCTELGVSCIVPVMSDRTLLNPSSQKLERWRRIAQEAAEQSERQIVPTILDPVPFPASFSLTQNQPQYICVARGDSPHLLNCLQDKAQNSTEITIAIGPEGGWTPAEIEQAIAAGYQPVSLGRRILRAITAPIVALSLTVAAWEAT